MTPIQTISAEELHKRLNTEKETVLLDVRQPEEKTEGDIPNSLLIPLGELVARVNELDRLKDSEIIIYCRGGMRSAQACQYLNQRGFTTKNLSGGIMAWNGL